MGHSPPGPHCGAMLLFCRSGAIAVRQHVGAAVRFNPRFTPRVSEEVKIAKISSPTLIRRDLFNQVLTYQAML